MGYLYHCTSADRVPAIQKGGLKPSEDPHWGGDLGERSYGKVFFATSPDGAYYYGEIVFRENLESYGMAFPPILLRIKTQDLKDAVKSQDSDELYVQRDVPPQKIEVFWHGWKPVQGAGRDYWEDMGYRLNEDEDVYEDWEGGQFGSMNEVLENAKNFTLKTAAMSEEPKPTIFFVRHGKTERNSETGNSLDGKIRGFDDVPLDKEGRKQAKEIAGEFKGIRVAEIYTSDLSRAKDTAEEIAKATGAKLYVLPQLRPWDLGEMQGMTVRECVKEMTRLQENIEEPAPGGKSFGEFYRRIQKAIAWLKERAEKTRDIGAVVVVTHSRILLSIPCVLSDGDPTTVPQAGGTPTGRAVEIQKEMDNWAMKTLEDEEKEQKKASEINGKFYHVTERTDAKDILKNGFIGGWGDVGYGVYLYDDPLDAMDYAAKGGWDGSLKDLVIIEISTAEARRVPVMDQSWEASDYENMYWHPMDESNEEERWKPRMKVTNKQAAENQDYQALKRGTSMNAAELTETLAKTARVLCEGDRPVADQGLQALVGDPSDARTSTFAQFNPNPGTMQLPNPLSPIEGDEIFFAYMLPGAVFQAHDGSEWNILFYDGADSIQIENRWYPRISWYVSIGDIRRSIHQWIEPITQTVPPPPPGVDYSALPVKVMDKEKNQGDIDQLEDSPGATIGGW